MSKRTQEIETTETIEQIEATIEQAVEAETIMEQADEVAPVEEIEAEAQDEQDEPVTVETVAQLIVSTMNEESFTLYRAHVAVNRVLEIFQVTKDGKAYTIRPQMMYNYNNNKMVVKGEKVEHVTKDQLIAFIVKFVGKRVS